MKKSFIAFRQLLVSDQKLAESVEPGVRCFHNPTSVLWGAPASALLSSNSRGVAMPADLIAGRFAVISFIRIQESLPFSWKGNDNPREQCGELTCVMSIGPCNDQRQRDATPVHQYVALGSFFSPGPSDSGRLLPGQGEL